MKTKHILTAMALPALFAACTAEDIVNEGANTLQQRPMVENLTLKVVEGAESRYAVDGASSLKFNFETGDKIGAAIIDEYQPGVKPENWDVIPSLAGNTPFTYSASAGEWSAPEDLPLGLGHYLFVYPYNRADVNRAAVSYELPVVQKLYTEENGDIDLNAAIEASNKSFYSTVVTSSDIEDLDVDLKNLYAYPKFVINFDNGEKVTTVSKVVLAKKNGFEVKGGFNHEVVAAMFADNADSKFWTSKTDKTTDWNKVQTADVLTADENYATIETSEYLVAELPLNAEVEEVTNNKYIEVRFMMPGELIGEDASGLSAYTMYVYTDNGAYSFNLKKAVEFKMTTKPSAINRAIARGTANTLTIDKDDVTKDSKAPFIVTNVADWNELVAAYGDESVFTASKPINVVYVGSSLVLDETAEMPTEAYFHVNSVTVEGDVELCNVIADEVIVAKDAALTTCGTFTAASIVNKGELNVAAVYNNKGKAQKYNGLKAVVNYATVNVEEDAIAEFFFSNQKGGILNNEGTLTFFNENAVMTIDGEIQYVDGNNGTINNAGTINMGNFTNLAPEYKSNKKLVNMPTINNEGKILTKGDVINFGTIINEGTLSCKNQAGTFVNANSYNKYVGTVLAVLDAKEDGLTYITENKGEVIVYAPFQDDVVIEKQAGKVSYETAKASEAFYVESTGAISYVNNIYVADDYTLTATKNTITLNVMGDATIARTYNATKGYLAHVAELNVVEGTTVLGSDFSLSSMTVAEDAMVKVPAGKTLKVSSSKFENLGEIEVAGTFSALNVSGASAEAGLVTESGANAEIKWKENATADAKKQAYMDALENVVADFIGNSSRYDYTVNCEQFLMYVEHVVGASTATDEMEEHVEALEEAMEAAEIDSISDNDIKEAFANVAADNKEDLIEILEEATFTQDVILYDKKTGAKATGETYGSAYEALKKAIVEQTQGNVTDKVLAYAATALSEAEIDAILAEVAPYAYIWEGSKFDKLVSVWVKYADMTSLDSDFSKAVANNKVNLKTLKDFMKTVKGGSSATSVEIQGLISDWTMLELNNMKYHDNQVKACARVAYLSTTGKNPTW